MAYATFNLVVRERTLDGLAPARVSVLVTPIADNAGTVVREIKDTTGDLVLSGAASVNVTGTGAEEVTVNLPDPRDTDLVPTGFGYSVHVSTNYSDRPVTIFGPEELDTFAVDQVIYLEDITDVAASSFHSGVAYATTADVAEALAAAEAYTDASGGGGGGGIVPDATLTVKGKLQLAGDLGGTASSPTVPGLAAKATTSALNDEVARATAAEAAITTSGTPDATSSVKGKLQLAGDLAGTAAAPTVPGLTTALQKTSNLSDLASATTARTNLGLGSSATRAVGTTAGTVAAGDDSRFSGGGVTPDVAVILAKDHGTLDPTGATDMAPVLRSCYTAALTALASGAASTEIVWPAGSFKMSTTGSGGNTTGGAALVLRSDSGGHTGQVRLRGQGIGATTFKMTTSCPTLVANINSDSGTFGNLVLDQFTVDHQNINVAGRITSLLVIFQVAINIDRVTVQDVNVLNMHAPNGSTVVQGISMGPGSNDWNDSIQYTTKNVFIRRCKFLGGNYGVQIQAYSGAAGTALQRDADILAGGNAANAFFDNIIIENFEWDSQVASFAAAVGVGDSAGVMIGQAGVFGKLRITDCVVKGSYDVGYEIDSCYDAILTRCYSEDALNANFYFRHQGGLPEFDAPTGTVPNAPAYERCNFTMVDCTARNKKLASTTQGATPSGTVSRNTGFTMHAFDHGIPSGNVVIRNFTHILDGPRTMYGEGHVNQIGGGFRSIDIDGMKVSDVNFSHDQPYTVLTGALFVSLPQGRGTFRLRDLEYTLKGKNTSGGSHIEASALVLADFADYNLDIDGIRSRFDIDGTGGPNYFTEIVIGNNYNGVDTFASTAFFTMGWRNDLTGAGQSINDFAATGTILNVPSPGTKEYRLTQIRNESQQIYGGGQVGPVTDQNVSVAAVKPTTPANGYKHGVRLKVKPETGDQSIHCYVDYTGTNYRLRIDTELAGVLTNRASTTIGTSIAATYYVRGKIIGDVVTAEYLTATPTSAVLPAPAATATYTLNETDVTVFYFSSEAPQGYPGLVWKPLDSGSKTAEMRAFYMSVVGGRISRVVPHGVIGAAASAALELGTAAASDQLRLRGTLELSEWDMAGYGHPGSTLVNITDPLITQNLRANRWNYRLTAPAAAAITVTGSPFTYTNTAWYDKDVAVYGGTVSVVSVTRRGGSASQVSDSTGRIVRLAPGEAVTVTYSVAPTMRQTPVA